MSTIMKIMRMPLSDDDIRKLLGKTSKHLDHLIYRFIQVSESARLTDGGKGLVYNFLRRKAYVWSLDMFDEI